LRVQVLPGLPSAYYSDGLGIKLPFARQAPSIFRAS
jgi:hypothetical protein